MKENISNNVVCLVGLSTSRIYSNKMTQREKSIHRRLKECFPTYVCTVDSMPQCFDLNQEFIEVITPLRTSFGLMDFVSLPLKDSIWINKLFLTKELDIVVSYVENYGKDNQTYQSHRSFPNWENISRYPMVSREREFNRALNDMMEKNNLI